MNIRETFDKLNKRGGKKGNKIPTYQSMTADQIKKLIEESECPIAKLHGKTLIVINADVNPLHSQVAVSLECPCALDGEWNGIFYNTYCSLTGDLCWQHCALGDYESGLGIYIHEQERSKMAVTPLKIAFWFRKNISKLQRKLSSGH